MDEKNKVQEELDRLNTNLEELSEEDLEDVSGGSVWCCDVIIVVKDTN